MKIKTRQITASDTTPTCGVVIVVPIDAQGTRHTYYLPRRSDVPGGTPPPPLLLSSIFEIEKYLHSTRYWNLVNT